MTERIKIAIAGYGNIGRGVEAAIEQNEDMTLTAVFSRRDPGELKVANKNAAVYRMEEAKDLVGAIDVVILCGGSARDLPVQGPQFAALFNTVDSYDNHARIPQYFAAVDKVARETKHTCVISTGWDPGLFSLMRVLEESVLPRGESYTFWGPGVSQGHSDAARRVDGVADARQYTIPVEKALQRVKSGENPELSTRDRHIRDCYVVAEEGADRERIRHEIVNMPDYYVDYETRVTFISKEEMKQKHSTMPHGGLVLRGGRTTGDCRHVMEFGLKLDSNPEFTGNVLVAYARAAYRMNREGHSGAKTVFDIPAACLSIKTREELLGRYL